MKEQQLSKLFRNHFEQWFEITPEVRPDNSRKRIDYILKKDGRTFGVELKKPGRKTGYNLRKLIEQASGYAAMTFDGEKIPILIAPAISTMFVQLDNGHHIYHPHHNLNPILALNNVGEIRKCWYQFESMDEHLDSIGYAFIFNNKLLWHERKGFYNY